MIFFNNGQEMQDKIQTALRNVLEPGEFPVLTFQTAWKPTFGTPTLWCCLTTSRLVLFSTLRKGKVFKAATFKEINSITVESDKRSLRVLLWDATLPDISFRVSDSVPPELVEKFLVEAGAALSKAAGRF